MQSTWFTRASLGRPVQAGGEPAGQRRTGAAGGWFQRVTPQGSTRDRHGTNTHAARLVGTTAQAQWKTKRAGPRMCRNNFINMWQNQCGQPATYVLDFSTDVFPTDCYCEWTDLKRFLCLHSLILALILNIFFSYCSHQSALCNYITLHQNRESIFHLEITL